MIRYSRNLVLDAFDYNNNKLCTLYDNSSDVSGQAHDVFVVTERNGWRELNFNLPSTINTEGGTEPNFRVDYIKPDYRIRLIDDQGVDWFLITEPSFSHKGYEKDVSVRAGHICQLLKTKNLGLEFSDEYGNNVGTAQELLTTILDGTGWSVGNVDTFYEKDGTTIKKRSMKASAKTGAFKLISNMCDLFDAKPVYHGDNRTVDIVPQNPFSKPQDGSLPDVTNADGVLELAYSHNVSNVTRSMNSENIVTKLYAYGSFGDQDHGYCGIDECVHTEHVFVTSSALAANKTYWFSFIDDSGITVKRNFTTDRSIPRNSKITYSLLDPASQMYVWVEAPSASTFGDVHEEVWADVSNTSWAQISNQVSVNGHAYLVSQGEAGTALPTSSAKQESVQNWFSFLLDFEYFQEVNLLTELGLQKIAGYQQFAKACNQLIYLQSLEMSAALLDLTETIGSVDFCKLNVRSADNNGGYLRIRLNLTSDTPDGIIYRSDYDTNRKEHFLWTPSPEIKDNGDPKTAGASMLFIVYGTTPVTWTKGYLKAMDDKDHPEYLTFHIDYDSMTLPLPSTAKVFLFGSNNINGWLGAYEINDEANLTAINNKTKVVTVNHPLQIVTGELPTIVPINEATVPDYVPGWYKMDGYGWCWRYYTSNTASRLYFCYYDVDETTWRRTWVQRTAPTGTISDGGYWYDWSTSKLYRRVEGQWVWLDGDEYKKITPMFGPVYKAARNHDKFFKGIAQYYTYTVGAEGLPAGNYYMEGPYDAFYAFTLTTPLSEGDRLAYDTTDSWIEMAKNGTLEPIGDLPAMEPGTISDAGNMIEDTTKCRSSDYIQVTPGQSYSFTGLSIAYPLTVYKYNSSYELQEVIHNLSGYDGSFTAETGITYIKLGCAVSAQIFNRFTSFKIINGIQKVIETKEYRFDNVNYPDVTPPTNATIIIQDNNYTRLEPIVSSGTERGIMPLTNKFAEKADEVYQDHYAQLIQAQNTLSELDLSLSNGLGDMYREGYWQKNDYVDGDEDKLYEDALDTIKEISKPKATYHVTYLDLYGSDNDETYGAAEITAQTAWPDLSIQSAVHLVDEEIGTNCWAYIDKINKCYDKPWQTAIAINTELTTLGQHSFADVLANIADVASSLKGKETIIDRATAITSTGQMAAQRLQGAIDAAKLAIFGGASTWYTDDRGNIVFESADHSAAMTLTGAGFAIANSKNEYGEWNWRTFGTGDGFTADEIVAGFISGERIEAGTLTSDQIKAYSITANRLSSDVGASLDLSSNQDIQLVVSGLNNKVSNDEVIAKINLSQEGIQIAAQHIGFTGDVVFDSQSNSVKIAQGVVTTNKLASDVGSSLDISSNTSITSKVSTSDYNGTTIASLINQSPTTVSINAQHINLTGDVSVESGTGAVRINNGVITANKLQSDVGQSLDLSSNNSLHLYVAENTSWNYVQWEDPALDSSNTIHNGDIWIQSNGIRTWGDVGNLTWGEVSAYKWKDFTDAKQYIRKNNTWILADDPSTKYTIRSGIDILPDGITIAGSKYIRMLSGSDLEIKTGSTFTVESGNFSIDEDGNVSMTGAISAASGQIADWVVMPGRLESGEDTGYVALDSDPSNTYAIWAGAEAADTAPFRVTRDGTVYALKVVTQTKDEGAQPQNLTDFPMWKLWYHVIYSYNSNSITLSNGDTINFNTAAATTLSGSWSGLKFTVLAKDAQDQTVATKEETLTRVITPNQSGATLSLFDSTHRMTLSVGATSQSVGPLWTWTIDASGEYNAGVTQGQTTGYTSGWDAAYGMVSPPAAGTGTSFSVVVPDSTVETFRALTFTISKGSTPGSSGYAAVSRNGTTVARIAIGDWYDAGVSDGLTTGKNAVTINKGSWSSGRISFTKSEGAASTQSVALSPGSTTWGTGSNINTATVKIYDVQGGGSLDTGVSVTVDASGRYTAGHSAGWADARSQVSPPASGTGTSFTFGAPSATEGSQQTYTFTLQKGSTPGSSGYASVSRSGTTVGRIAIGDWYDAGWNAALDACTGYTCYTGTIKQLYDPDLDVFVNAVTNYSTWTLYALANRKS